MSRRNVGKELKKKKDKDITEEELNAEIERMKMAMQPNKKEEKYTGFKVKVQINKTFHEVDAVNDKCFSVLCMNKNCRYVWKNVSWRTANIIKRVLSAKRCVCGGSNFTITLTDELKNVEDTIGLKSEEYSEEFRNFITKHYILKRAVRFEIVDET